METSEQAGLKTRLLLGVLAAAVFLTLGLAGCGDKKPKDGDVDMSCHECMDEDYPDVEPDADGYITWHGIRYRTVKIGSLAWMAENLNGEMDYGSWCYDDNEANCAKYGRLYANYIDINMAICPPGWRLPSVQDWDNLFVAAGGSFDEEKHRWNAAGSKLKSKTGWKDKGNGTDDLGFSALPGGFRDGVGSQYLFAGEGGYWWAYDEKKNGSYRAMGWDMSHVNENRFDRTYYGLSVRCVRGDTDPPAPGAGRRPVPAAPEVNAALPAGTTNTRWYKPKARSFIISAADQLAGLAELVNGGNTFEGITISLSGDIDLSAYGRGSAFNGGKGWIPIGDCCCDSESRPFRGAFDGNGQKIRGLYINDPELRCAGLFGYIEGAVTNLGIADANITGGNNVGGVVGNMDGKARVANCHSTGAVNGIDNVGGLAGYAGDGGSLSGSYSAAAVTGELSVGGVVGHAYFTDVTGCYFTGAVRGNTDVGGVAGLTYVGKLTNCYSAGTVSGRAGRVGGVVGRSNCGDVVSCYSTAAVSGREGTGGVVGSIVRCGQLSNCAALNPSVSGTGASAGRVLGYNDGTISNNAAFISLKDIGGRTERWAAKGADNNDGQNITVGEIADDGTIGGRFTADGGWTTEEGKLPGLGGNAAEMPEHLR